LESIGDNRPSEIINEKSILTQNPEDSLVIESKKGKESIRKKSWYFL
jgi:hypothetical protein